MKKLILITFLVGTFFADAKTINVADFGIVPGQDATYKLNRLLEKIQNEPNVTLSFPKGQYDFHPENAVEMHRAIANHDNGLKRMAFNLFNHKNITIDGGGSLFMMHGRILPFTIENSNGVTLKNFSIDFIRSFHAELEVIANEQSTKSITVKIDPVKYPYIIKDGELLFDRFGQIDQLGANMVFDPKTRSPIYNTNQYRLGRKSIKATKAGKNQVSLKAGFKKVPPVGSVLVVYGTHPTSRLCQAIHITNSKDALIKNVTVYGAGGMGLIVERTENITLDGMKVTSTNDRMVATRADATHFIGCKGTIKLENCLFEHMLDDGVNVHGAYVPVAKYRGNNEFICDISHFQQWGLIFGEPGDKIALMSRETVLPFFETRIKSVRILNEHRFILTVAEVPETMPELMSVENMTWYPDLIMRNNIIRENRARSVLVTTKGKVLIENNYFSSQMHGILIEGDNNKWYESGAVEDVIIRNNEFVNIGYSKDKRYPLLAAPLLTKDQRWGDGQYHRNIHFVNNKIKSFNGHLVEAFSVQGLNVSGNIIEFSTDYPAAEEGPAIHLTYCDDVTIEKNTFKGFNKPTGIEKTDDTTNAKIAKNKGL